jgi:hypothetical protein
LGGISFHLKQKQTVRNFILDNLKICIATTQEHHQCFPSQLTRMKHVHSFLIYCFFSSGDQPQWLEMKKQRKYIQKPFPSSLWPRVRILLGKQLEADLITMCFCWFSAKKRIYKHGLDSTHFLTYPNAVIDIILLYTHLEHASLFSHHLEEHRKMPA